MNDTMYELQQDLAIILLKIKEHSSEEEMIGIVLDFVSTLSTVRKVKQHEAYVPEMGPANKH